MVTSRWALESGFDKAIKREIKAREDKLLQDALDYCKEIDSEDRVDNGTAFFAEY